MNNIEDAVYKTIIKYNMIKSGDKILVGLSGGPDSVFLLTVIGKLKNKLEITLGAAHLNHCIRGEEADRDEIFSKKLCADLKIDYYSKKADIPLISKAKKISEESAGRQERYAFFNELCKKYGFNKIAVAHNMNDSVETILINMIRGCSLNGLEGISPINGNVIRPIIETERQTIEKYLSDNGIDYCIDSTNNGNDYTRNKIRHMIMPVMTDINSSAVKTIFRNSLTVKDDNAFMDRYAKDLNCIQLIDGDIAIDKKRFDIQSTAIKRRILLLAFKSFFGNLLNIEQKHIDILCGKLNTGEKYDMPSNLTVYISYDKIFLKNKTEKVNTVSQMQIYPNGRFDISDGYTLETSLIEKTDDFNEHGCIYIDFDKVSGSLTVRKRKDGDRMIPYGMSGSKKIKQIFNELKIPSEKRDGVPILTDENNIAAIIPYRVSDLYKVTKETKKILKIQYIRRFENGTK